MYNVNGSWQTATILFYLCMLVWPSERNRQVNYVICRRADDFNIGPRERLTNFSEMRAVDDTILDSKALSLSFRLYDIRNN